METITLQMSAEDYAEFVAAYSAAYFHEADSTLSEEEARKEFARNALISEIQNKVKGFQIGTIPSIQIN